MDKIKQLKTGQRVKIIKPLKSVKNPDKPLVDKHGTWYKIEILDGDDIGMRMPASDEDFI